MGVNARVAAYAAMGMSSLAVISCILFVPMLWARVTAINDHIRANMVDFRATTRDIHSVMQSVRQADASSTFERKKRQAPQGQCSELMKDWCNCNQNQIATPSANVHRARRASRDCPDPMASRERQAGTVMPACAATCPPCM